MIALVLHALLSKDGYSPQEINAIALSLSLSV